MKFLVSFILSITFIFNANGINSFNSKSNGRHGSNGRNPKPINILDGSYQLINDGEPHYQFVLIVKV